MFSGERYMMDVATGTTASSLAEELRTRLPLLLSGGAYNISVEKLYKNEGYDKYAVNVLRGNFSGMRIQVEMQSQASQATVHAKAFSKVESVLVEVGRVVWWLLAIPTFILLVKRWDLAIAVIGTLLSLAPGKFVALVANTAVMSILYAITGNEFDEARRAGIVQALKRLPEARQEKEPNKSDSTTRKRRAQ